MINAFEQEMFDFFTTEQTFINMARIAGHYPLIRTKLIHEFWTEVKNRVRASMLSKCDNWTVHMESDVRDNTCKLMLYKKEWGTVKRCPQMAISYEHLSQNAFLGPFLHNQSSQLDHKAALGFLRGLEYARAYLDNYTSWYPFWLYTDLNFNLPEDLEKILPTRRAEWIEPFAKQMIDMAVALEDSFDQISDQYFIRQKTTYSI